MWSSQRSRGSRRMHPTVLQRYSSAALQTDSSCRRRSSNSQVAEANCWDLPGVARTLATSIDRAGQQRHPLSGRSCRARAVVALVPSSARNRIRTMLAQIASNRIQRQPRGGRLWARARLTADRSRSKQLSAAPSGGDGHDGAWPAPDRAASRSG